MCCLLFILKKIVTLDAFVPMDFSDCTALKAPTTAVQLRQPNYVVMEHASRKITLLVELTPASVTKYCD
jgi:hypothetical protein